MNCPEVRKRLDDYLEDALSSAERRAVEDHLSDCHACRSELSSIGALLDTAQDLKRRRLDPGQDLWPEIRRRLADPARGRQRSWRARLGLESPRFVWPFAAAAAVLVIALWAGGRIGSRRPFLRGSGTTADRAASAPADTSATGFGRQAADLGTEVSTAREQVHRAAQSADSSASGSWKVFDDNLQVLDSAIRDSRVALAQDPDNPVLQRSLLGAYQKQLELLRWASRIVRQG